MISVIIPTYNRSHILSQSLKSVTNQTLDDLEIIVVDGSDNDKTQILVSQITDKRIKYIRTQNISAAHSRNIGIQNAAGDIIAFNDDDDIWYEHKLSKQYNIFKKCKSDKVVYSAYTKTFGKYIRIVPDSSISKKCGNIYEELLLHNIVGMPTVMLPLSLCRQIVFDENLQCIEDWDWVIRLAQHYNFEFIEEPLVMAGNTPKSVNKSNYRIKTTAYKRIYEKYYADIKRFPNVEAKHLLSIGNNICLSGNLSEGRSYLRKALKLKSPRVVIFISYFLSFLGHKTYYLFFKIFEQSTRRQP